MREWSDRDIPHLAVQMAGIGASFPAHVHDIRHGRPEAILRPRQRDTAHKNWLTRVALGAPENILGWLWPISGIQKASKREGKRANCTLSSCPTGCMIQLIKKAEVAGALNIYLFIIMDAQLNLEDGRFVSAIYSTQQRPLGISVRADRMWKNGLHPASARGPLQGDVSTYCDPVPHHRAQ